jgi:hypothetical protein
MSERYPESGTVEVPSGNNAVHTVLSLGSGQSIDVDYIKVGYRGNATTAATVSLYDEDSGTAPADLDRDIESFQLADGADRAVIEDPSLDVVERDVVLQADGNQDAVIQVTVGGNAVTG